MNITDNVRGLTEAILADGDTSVLPILADALEDGGEDTGILTELRGGGLLALMAFKRVVAEVRSCGDRQAAEAMIPMLMTRVIDGMKQALEPVVEAMRAFVTVLTHSLGPLLSVMDMIRTRRWNAFDSGPGVYAFHSTEELEPGDFVYYCELTQMVSMQRHHEQDQAIGFVVGSEHNQVLVDYNPASLPFAESLAQMPRH